MYGEFHDEFVPFVAVVATLVAPVPLSATLCGPEAAPDTLAVAVYGTEYVWLVLGVNVSVTVHWPPAGRLAHEVLAKFPLAEMTGVPGAVPVFDMVRV